jgi:hypothetical protein
VAIRPVPLLILVLYDPVAFRGNRPVAGDCLGNTHRFGGAQSRPSPSTARRRLLILSRLVDNREPEKTPLLYCCVDDAPPDLVDGQGTTGPLLDFQVTKNTRDPCRRRHDIELVGR